MKTKNNVKTKNFFLVLLKIFLIISIVIVLVVLTVGAVFAIYVDKKVEKTIDVGLFEIVGSESATEIYYYEYSDRANRKGEAVKLENNELFGGYRSKYIEYNNMPQDLIDAFISIEDKRFMQHKGVDWKRTVSAGLNYFLKFNGTYGGSTITQQLIKNVTNEDDYSFQRKIQEIFWALDLETKMDKTEILGLYLNIINLSQGCYGVGAAAEYYFSKHPSELTLAECATIAAITNSPTYYDPIRNPEHNVDRRNLILRQMYEQEYISQTEYQNALAEDLIIDLNDEHNPNATNSWYVDMVIEDIINDLCDKYGYSRQMANLIIYTGGLKIYTVMDAEVQKILDKYYSEKAHFKISDAESPQSSMIIIDPYTGDILGVAGAVGEKNANRIQNYATETVRPAGSAIKPLSVYAPALEEGIITWSTVYDDTPVNFGNYNTDKNLGEIIEPVAWPKNSNGIYRGLTDINYALTHSINTVTVKVLEDLGLEESFDFLYSKFRVQSIINSKTLDSGEVITDKDYAALALGQFNYGTTVKEITAAYSAFLNRGVYSTTRSYYAVLDDEDNPILENKYDGEAIISEETASLMTLMLKNVVKSGTAKDVTLKNKIDCAGKTGTTQNNCDKWFIGYTPYYLGGVWYGYDYPKAINDTVGNRSVKIWDEVMTLLHEKYLSDAENIKKFEINSNIVEYEYCADSGELLTTACRNDARGDRARTGYCIGGSEPTNICSRHVLVDYDTVTGGVYMSGCPTENVKKVGLIAVERSFPIQIYITDAQYTWRDIGKDTAPQTSPSLPFYNNLLGEGEYSGISNVPAQFNRACREHFNYFEWKKKTEKQPH